MQSRMSECLALVGRVSPQSIDGTAVTSAYLTPAVLGQFGRIIVIAQTGANSTGDVTVSLVKAKDASGTGVETVAEADALSGTAGDDKDIMLNFDVNATDPDKPYLALKIEVSTSTCLVSGVLLAGDGRVEPAQEHNASSVAQVVA